MAPSPITPSCLHADVNYIHNLKAAVKRFDRELLEIRATAAAAAGAAGGGGGERRGSGGGERPGSRQGG